MALSLAKELDQFGTAIDPKAFEKVLRAVKREEAFRRYTTEGLMYDPKKGAIPFCDEVRKRVCPRLTDEMILRRLTNLRKRNRVKA